MGHSHVRSRHSTSAANTRPTHGAGVDPTAPTDGLYGSQMDIEPVTAPEWQGPARETQIGPGALETVALSDDLARYIHSGVANDSFQLPPPSQTAPIDGGNPLPYWEVGQEGLTPPVVTWGELNGRGKLVLSLPAGVTGGDLVRISQIIPIHATETQPDAYAVSLNYRWVSGALGAPGPFMFINTHFLTATGAVTGGFTGASILLTSALWRDLFWRPNTTGIPPVDATHLYIEIAFKREDPTVTGTSVAEVSGVRLFKGVERLIIPDSNSAHAPAEIIQQNGLLTIKNKAVTGGGEVSISSNGRVELESATGQDVRLDASSARVHMQGAVYVEGGFIDMTEIAAPVAPAAGSVRLYPKADGKLYSKDDAGVETALGGGAAAAFVGVKAMRTAVQSITTATDTDILFTAADAWDTDGFHDPAVNSDRLTVPAGKGGKYTMTANVEFPVNGTGQRKLTITVNGVAMEGGMNTAAAPNLNHRCCVTVEAQLAAGDIVRANVRQNSGGALNVELASLSIRYFAA